MLLTRKPGMGREAFRDYWLNVHGPLVMGIPEIRRHVLKYVQCHTLDEWYPFLPGDGPLYDGAAEVWCESLEAAQAMFAEPRVAETVMPDEQNFLAPGSAVILLLQEHLVYQRPEADIHGGIKLFEVPVRKPGLTRAECQRHWLRVHGPLVRNSPAMTAPLRRYVQSHALEDSVSGISPMPYEGLAELWFDNSGDLLSCFGDDYRARVQPDEHNFADLGRCAAIPAREYIIYERDARPAAS